MSNRIPVTEASVEIGVDGRLRVRYREVPVDRDRLAPSLGECIAALVRYRHRALTPERHRAGAGGARRVRGGLARGSARGCGRLARRRFPLRQGDTSRCARRHFRPGKATLLRPRRRFGGEGDAFGPQSVGFAVIRPSTVSQASTPLGREG